MNKMIASGSMQSQEPLAPGRNIRYVTRTAQCLVVAILLLSAFVNAAKAGTKAATARAVITPTQPVWLSGYASRTEPPTGKLHDLWAKTLVLEDDAGKRVVLITLDLIGIDRDTSQRVRNSICSRHQLDPAAIAICTTHTHSGPVVGNNLRSMYNFDEEQQKLIDDYTDTLAQTIAAIVDEAMSNLAAAEITWGSGTATFAVNRRNNPEAEVQKLREQNALRGPVDHALPVLTVRDANDELIAVACGYACHATVLSGQLYCGDWPGYAAIEIEKAHPGATALVWAGCGADQNPLPRRTVELAENYGRQLAAGVEAALAGELRPVTGVFRAAREVVPLALAELPTREQLVKEQASDNRYIAARANVLLAEWDREGKLRATYPYGVEVWQLGPDVTWVFLGGEVVVDYAIRLKQELGPSTWIAGYTNDVMAYIPSRRVLLEGGYEGRDSMVYYGLPGVWSPEIEETIVSSVKKIASER